jgi:hypothetical protein
MERWNKNCWNNGRMEGWKDGRMEGKARYKLQVTEYREIEC